MRSRTTATPFAIASGFILALSAAPARSSGSIDIRVHVGDPPPPPVCVFKQEPETVLIPSTEVYYVSGLEVDLFRYGRFWYMDKGGYWYRASAYSGPFIYVAYERVPRPIIVLPGRYHRHPLGGPPGLMRKRAVRASEHDGNGRPGRDKKR